MLRVYGFGTNAYLDLNSTNASGRDFQIYSDGNTIYVKNATNNAGTFAVRNSSNNIIASYDYGAPSGSFILDSSGNVGIGTTSPANPLHVYGSFAATPTINLQNLSATGYTQLAFQGTGRTFFTGVGNSSGGLGVANKYYVWDSSSSAMRFVIDTSGNVGIGTTSPLSTLSVAGNLAVGSYGGGASTTAAPSNGLIVSGNVGIGTTSPISYFDVRVGANERFVVANPLNVAGAVQLLASNDANTVVVPMEMRASQFTMNGGNVGIGTTSPQSSLQLGTDLTFGYNWPRINFNSYFNGTNNILLTTNSSAAIEEDYTNGGLGFFTGSSGTAGSVAAFTEAMFIKGNGNVGIGTTSPSNLVVIGDDIGASANPSRTLTIGATSSVPGINIGQSAANKLRIYWQYNATAANAYADIGVGAGTNPLVLQESGGNVGIGTTSPSNKLDVSGGMAVGAAYIGTNSAPSNGMIVQGNVGIGTTSPAFGLDVWSNFRTRTSSTANLRIVADWVGTGGSTINSIADDSSTSEGLSFSASKYDFSGGNVGIGTTSPSATLDVNGAMMTECVTVSTLPTGKKGMRHCVTDATSCTFLGALTGGGATFCPVVYSGSAWVGG